MGPLSRIFGPRTLKLTRNLGAYRLPNGDVSPLYVFFDVLNAGRESVGVTSVRVAPKKTGEPLDVVPEGELPTRLAAGENVRFRVRAKALARASRDAGHAGKPKLVLLVTDGNGNEHRHAFVLRVDEYLALKDE